MPWVTLASWSGRTSQTATAGRPTPGLVCCATYAAGVCAPQGRGRGRRGARGRGAPRPSALFSDEVVAVLGGGDLGFVTLNCCTPPRGGPWRAPAKPFFFRAPPTATKVLTLLGVDCVSLANNHALD